MFERHSIFFGFSVVLEMNESTGNNCSSSYNWSVSSRSIFLIHRCSCRFACVVAALGNKNVNSILPRTYHPTEADDKRARAREQTARGNGGSELLHAPSGSRQHCLSASDWTNFDVKEAELFQPGANLLSNPDAIPVFSRTYTHFLFKREMISMKRKIIHLLL